MDKSLYERILEDVRGRDVWARKQEMWYRMRGPGIRRTRLPWPGAANLHYPLVDGIIDKQKPFFLQQLYSNPRFADFTGKPGIEEEMVQAAASWFDYKLRYHSNLEEEIAFANDDTLVYGRGIIKCTWSVSEKKIRHESIEPLYIIVPEDCVTLRSAERVVHVRHLTPWEYKNGEGSEKYNQDKDFVKTITGRNDETQSDSHTQAKKLARGITHSTDNIIILWEVYERNDDGDWVIHTISPMRPDDPVRSSFGMPYKFYGKHPFVDFTFEERKGYYETRGICEILADMEGSMNKMWNEKHDAMTLYNRPVFAAERDVPSTANIRMAPGSILPFAIRALNPGAPPISFDQEMANTRFIAEQRVAVPDFGTGSQKNPLRDNKTATEVQAVQAQQQLVVDMRARAYKRSLGEVYCLDWYLLRHYDKDLRYSQDGETYEMDPVAMEAIESIEPSGTADAWDTQKRQQKAVLRFQMFRGDPFILQGPLRKNILALDEPGLVKELYQDPRAAEMEQAERQMIEIPALEAGLPLTVGTDDDHFVHLDILMKRSMQNMQEGKQFPPAAQQASQQHINGHLQGAQQVDNNRAKQMAKQFEQLGKAYQQQIAQQQMLQEGPTQGRLPMQ